MVVTYFLISAGMPTVKAYCASHALAAEETADGDDTDDELPEDEFLGLTASVKTRQRKHTNDRADEADRKDSQVSVVIE